MGQPWCCRARHALGVLLVVLLARSSHSASNETTAAPTAITSTPAPAPAAVGGKPRKVATPVFTPSDAQPYVLSVSITISCATEVSQRRARVTYGGARHCIHHSLGYTTWLSTFNLT